MDSALACLAAWMPRQRWYAAKGRRPSLRLISWWDFPTDDSDARVRTFLLADEGALPVVVYQVPVVARPTAAVAASDAHVIGSPEPGTTFIDGPHDPAYVSALLQLVLSGGTVSGPHATASGHPIGAPADTGPLTATVLTGEQSNTSLISPATATRPAVICKIFRQVNRGRNPDIELQTALAGARSPHIAPAVGWLEGTWLDAGDAQRSVGGSLAFAQQYLSGVEDAWRVALRAAADGTPFDQDAHALGRATADVHMSLAQLFPTHPAGPGDIDGFAETWRRRLAIALSEVPAIAERRTAIEAVYARALAVARPTLQRIHGDYHLGQVLHTADDWVLLDFEGEPLRPIRERVRPDVAMRDVAGMLRSFDYVAGSIRLDDPDRPAEAVRAWVEAARGAFIGGYAEATGTPLDADDPLLAALELDKAVYEAIYEARNRPTWVAIPLRAIGRLARTHPE